MHVPVITLFMLPLPNIARFLSFLLIDFSFWSFDVDLECRSSVLQEVEVRWFEQPCLRRVQRVIVHKYFSYLGIMVAFCNVIIISVSERIHLVTAVVVHFVKNYNTA